MAGHEDEALEKLLSDPLTLSLMRADRVDPIVLRADLQRVAERVYAGKFEGSAQGPGADTCLAWSGLLRDCRATLGPGPSAAPRSNRA